MGLFEKILNRQEKIAVIGLGYVGLPLAMAFSKKTEVIGYDIDRDKIKGYKLGIDYTGEIGEKAFKKSNITFTEDANKLKEAKFFIIAVPTPIKLDKTPDLNSVINASKTVAKNLTKGSIVVYESTVYPGVTEEICIPILEEESNLVCGRDFKVGYSPERINPGDKINKLENIIKIVSAIDKEALEEIANIYNLIIEAGVHKVSSIKVAEATKIAENSQRDINIAYMNELSMVFDRMGIDTFEVIEAMNTKWNALGFYPGLVGGHCIGVDPYYFIYEAEKLGYHSQIIISGRKINDSMPRFIVESIIKKLILANKNIKESKIVIMGLSFKEDCKDLRNSKVEEIVKLLRGYGIEPDLVDPIVDEEEIVKIYGKKPIKVSEIEEGDLIILAVPHKEFEEISYDDLDLFYKPIPNNERIIIDIKRVLDREWFEKENYIYWSL
ncbi:MAG: nucleotide sugar dehydrogenase [Tissierellia bacterium]|nr:nucleotide sugar dehydrogenase [Tissierellia bacterium]